MYACFIISFIILIAYLLSVQVYKLLIADKLYARIWQVITFIVAVALLAFFVYLLFYV